MFRHFSPATVVQPNKDMKDMSEQQELDHYQEGNVWLEEAQQDMAWIHRLQSEAQTVDERRVSGLLIEAPLNEGWLVKALLF